MARKVGDRMVMVTTNRSVSAFYIPEGGHVPCMFVGVTPNSDEWVFEYVNIIIPRDGCDIPEGSIVAIECICTDRGFSYVHPPPHSSTLWKLVGED